MKIVVPASVDAKRLVEGLNLSPTKSKNRIERINYFLFKFVSYNDNYKLNEKNNGYRNISSDLMKNILGNKEYRDIRKMLR
jgi:uncharacterized protein with von Willebrand factor type A (vWA) domain